MRLSFPVREKLIPRQGSDFATLTGGRGHRVGWFLAGATASGLTANRTNHVRLRVAAKTAVDDAFHGGLVLFRVSQFLKVLKWATLADVAHG